MGVAISNLLAGTGITPLIATLPPLTVRIPLLPIGTGQLGLAVTMAALVGAVVPDPAARGLLSSVSVSAGMWGWGIGVTMTPMSSSAIITAPFGPRYRRGR